MASQPMWLHGLDRGVTGRHVPDLLMKMRDGPYVVCDVKPAKVAERPEVAAVFDWTARVCKERGWRYGVWSGADPVVLNNVRFLAAGRRLELIDQGALRLLNDVVRDGMTVGEVSSLAERSGAVRLRIRPALLSLIWQAGRACRMGRSS